MINKLIKEFKITKAAHLALVGLIFLTILSSCKKNNVNVDLPEMATTPTAAEFVTVPRVNRVSYYVSSTGTGYKIPVGITNVSNVDRTLQLAYSSRLAVAGVQYNAPSSITIKAGNSIDTLNFQGLFAGYPSGRKDTVKIKFSNILTVSDRDSFELIMQRYCDVVLANLAGAYNNTKEYTSSTATTVNYGPYVTTVSSLVSTGATTATCSISNLFDDGWLPVTAVLDWTDPANFKVTIASQSIGKSYGGQPAFVKTSASPSPASTFSSCDGTITLRLDVTNAAGALLTASTGAASGYQIVLNR